MKPIDERIYACIVKYKRENDGVAPAMREICTYLNIASTSTIKNAFGRLQRAGKIELIPGKAGGIKVVGGRWSLASEERPVYEIDMNLYGGDIIDVKRKVEFDGATSFEELAVYTADGMAMQFPLTDKRLPADIEANPTGYRLCYRIFEAGKPQSKTGVTSVWFEQRPQTNEAESLGRSGEGL